MRYWLYGIGLAVLPVFYISLMLLTGQPIEWPVIGLMALIVLPIVIFRKRIHAAEEQVNAMSEEEQAKAVVKAAIQVAGRAVGSD